MTAAMSPDTLERHMREMTGIDTRDSSEESDKTSNNRENRQDVVSTKGSSSETEDVEGRKLSPVRERSPSRENSAGSDERERSISREICEEKQDNTSDAENMAEKENSVEREVKEAREKPVSRESTPPKVGSGDGESQGDEPFSLEDYTLDNGKLASSGPTLTQAEVEASMKKVYTKYDYFREMRVYFAK